MVRLGKLLDALAQGLGRLLRRPSPAAMLAGALLLGGALRLGMALTQPLDPHEAHYIEDARGTLRSDVDEAMRGNVHGWMPALVYGAILEGRAGAGPRELRLVQTAASLVVTGLLFLLGSGIADARTGGVAALLFALSPEAIAHGGSLTPYSTHMLFVLGTIVAYLGTLEGKRAPTACWSVALAASAALAMLHHPVSGVYLAALALHAMRTRELGARRAWALAALALGVLVSVPGWASGDPGKLQDLLLARLPDFLGRPLVLAVVFLALWDATVDRFRPGFHGILPYAFVVPIAVFLPYFRETYVAPGIGLWCLVLAAALVHQHRPRLVALVAVHVAVSDVGLLLQMASGGT